MTTPPAPWPNPRMTLTAEVGTDDRATTVFTVSNAKVDGTVMVDPGDGSGSQVRVTLTGGTGSSIPYRYFLAGHHVYTATVTTPTNPWCDPWADMPALASTWADVPPAVELWADIPRTSETATTTVEVDVGEATIWAEVIRDQPIDYVQVDTWISRAPDVVSWTVTRNAPGAPSVMSVDIHIGDTHPGSYSLEDRECPLGTAVTYTLTWTTKAGVTNSVTSQPVILAGTRGCFLTDTQSGRTVAVELQAWDERKRAARQSVLPIIGRAAPVVLTDKHLTPAGTWSLLTRKQGQLDQTIDVLTASRLVLLRTQPASSIPTTYAVVGDIDEVRVYPGDGAAWERLIAVAVQEVEPIPATAKALHIDWAAVATAFGTWADIPAAFPTWQDLSAWNPA